MASKKTKVTQTENATIIDNDKVGYLVIQPKTHEDWLKERNKGIGASECAKCIDASKYGTPYNLWKDKVGLNPPVKENWAMKQGHIFERVIAEMFQEQVGLDVIGLRQVSNVKSDWLAQKKGSEHLRVSPDYIYCLNKKGHTNLLERGVLECKTSIHHYTPECLKSECLTWYCQVQYQLYVLGLKEGYLGFLCVDSLTGGESWFEKIPYNEMFCEDVLIPAINDLWNNHIAPARELLCSGSNVDDIMKFAPEITSADDVSNRYPKEQIGKKISGDDIEGFYDSIAEYIENRNVIRTLEAKQKKFEDMIKLRMEDAEAIVGNDDKPIITFKASKPTKKFDSKRFESECGDMYDQYCFEQPGARRLIIKQ